jgi:hypothetical protein
MSRVSSRPTRARISASSGVARASAGEHSAGDLAGVQGVDADADEAVPQDAHGERRALGVAGVGLAADQGPQGLHLLGEVARDALQRRLGHRVRGPASEGLDDATQAGELLAHPVLRVGGDRRGGDLAGQQGGALGEGVGRGRGGRGGRAGVADRPAAARPHRLSAAMGCSSSCAARGAARFAAVASTVRATRA